MVKKTRTQPRTDDKQLADAVRMSAQQIWQAGLGAFAKAQDEGGKAFAKLVREGTELQRRTQKLAGEKALDVGETVAKVADGLGRQAAGSWDKLEQVFEDRVARALARIGVPGQKEIAQLSARIDELNAALAALGAGAPKPRTRRAAAPDGAIEAKVKASGAARGNGRAATKRGATGKGNAAGKASRRAPKADAPPAPAPDEDGA